ncbi:MAG: hypothetical protein E7047_04600 [Lentisphaerae bacterium]|nr:hypothetical protein [Lentisphaerota bacterium]
MTQLHGALGKALILTVNERLKKVDYRLLESPFLLRNETDGAWRCEFWGKIVRSAVLAAFYTGDKELENIVRQTVQNILATQTADGCISSYPAEKQLSGWDIWGRKYVLLALLRYYEVLDRDPAILQSCCRMVDHLAGQLGNEPGKKHILECGFHDGLASSSILGAIVALWRLSQQDKYRKLAEYIWQSGGSGLGNVAECVLTGIAPSALGNSKAYELTSFFQGAAEWEMLESDPRRRAAVLDYYQAVLEREIFITGTGGLKDEWGEYWYDGALRQTRSDCGSLGETCISTTWVHYAADILELTDDCRVADELEKTLYNAVLGAMHPSGHRWVHANPTPLTGGGWKRCADDQIGRGFGTPFGNNDCCLAQGPEALAMAPKLAVIRRDGRVTLNFFEPLTSGNLQVGGNYPYDEKVLIRFTQAEETTLRIRTPEFLKSIRMNGKSQDFTCGVYWSMQRQWSPDDCIELEFDFALREIPAPGNSNFVAVRRGPLVLAEDSRPDVPEARVQIRWRNKTLCEYASAGNLMNKENSLRVWFEQ